MLVQGYSFLSLTSTLVFIFWFSFSFNVFNQAATCYFSLILKANTAKRNQQIYKESWIKKREIEASTTSETFSDSKNLTQYAKSISAKTLQARKVCAE